MTFLAPMRPEAFPSYLEAAIADYAEENVSAGRWPRDSALARSERAFADLLPQGLETPNSHTYEIFDREGGEVVGFIWVSIQERFGAREAFVYNVEVLPAFQRQGHATRALEALHDVVAGLGVTRIGLHVFGNNLGAQALYRKLGYAVTGINMSKQIDGAQ